MRGLRIPASLFLPACTSISGATGGLSASALGDVEGTGGQAASATQRRPTRSNGSRSNSIALALSCAWLLGCARAGGDDLVIATAWPASERSALEDGFRRHLSDRSLRIGWVVLSPGDDPARAARGIRPVDVILGGPSSRYRQMGREGRLIPSWVVARRSPIGLALLPKTVPPTDLDPELAFDDPRRDPVSLAWAKSRLVAGDWAEGYARLARAAGSSPTIGRQPGASLAAFERNEIGRAVAARPGKVPFEPGPTAEYVEGAAIVRDCPHPDRARQFLEYLAPGGKAEEGDDTADALLADLLGATLVDAQDELKMARSLSTSDEQWRWTAEAPPWPPASVSRLVGRGEDGLALLDTLAAEVAPEPDARAWLARSWLQAPRPIDGEAIGALAVADGGRLAREPRFRAWLRAEWTAWARQRYRQAARAGAS